MAGMPKTIVVRKPNILRLRTSLLIKNNESNVEKTNIISPPINFQNQNSSTYFASNNKRMIIVENASSTLLDSSTPTGLKSMPKSKPIAVNPEVTSSAQNALSTLSAFKSEEDCDEFHITKTESTSPADPSKIEEEKEPKSEEHIEYLEEEYLDELLEDAEVDGVTEISEHTFDYADFAETYEQPGIVEVTSVEGNTDGNMYEIVTATEPSEDIECRICNSVFQDERSKEMHVAQEHHFYYECTQCEHKTANPEAAREHFRETHRSSLTELGRVDIEECVVGQDYIATEVLLEQQLMEPVVTNDSVVIETLECEYCSKQFSRVQLYQRHVARHKRKQDDARKILSSDEPAFCDECDITFESQLEWTKHVLNARRHKDKKRSILNGCKHCGYTFRSPNDLRVHTLDQHPAAKQRASTWTEPRPCDFCQEPMATSHAYWAHFRRAHPTEQYPLRQHMKHKCQQCGQAFRCKALLKMHMHKHTGTKLFECGECGKSFFTNLSLRYHQITHSEMRPFICDTCGRAFKFKAAMTRHKLVHTGERPFVCGVCGQGFTTMHWTQIHVRRVHNKEEIPYKPRGRRRNKLQPATHHQPA